MKRRRLLVLLAALPIALATLPPSAGPAEPLGTLCLVCGTRGAADIILNVALFAPFGAALAFWLRRERLAPVALGALVSIGIETLQLVIPGRDPNPGDVLANTLGAALGAGLVRLAPAWIAPARPRARGLGAAALLGAGVTVAATGALLRPALPDTVYYGQWTADLGHLEHYRGRVLDARVGDAAVPSRRFDDSDRLRDLIARGAPIRVTAIAGPRPTALAPIFSIYDDRRQEVLLLGADRDDLVFRYRTHGVRVRLDRPDLRLPGVLRGIRGGDMIRLAVERAGPGQALCLSAGDRHSCDVGFTAGRGWGLLLYREAIPGYGKRALDLAWLAALFAPAGFWLRRGREPVAAATLAVTGLVLIPPAAGLLATPPIEIAAALVGIGAGTAAGRAAGHAGRRFRGFPPPAAGQGG